MDVVERGPLRTIVLGGYPDLGVADARRTAAEVRERGESATGASEWRTVVDAIVEYWSRRSGITAGYVDDAMAAMRRHALPKLGRQQIATLDRAAVLSAQLKIDEAGLAEYARRCWMRLSLVLDCEVEHGRHTANLCATIRPRVVFWPKTVEHHAALTESGVPRWRAVLGAQPRELLSVIALRLVMLTWVRTSEAICATWSKFDLNARG